MTTKKCDCSGRPLGTDKCPTCQSADTAKEKPLWPSDATTCSACLNWEPRQNSGMGDGYCQIFDKFTDPDHGKRCTAFQPNITEAKTRHQEESWWQLSSSDLFADSRAEALAG